MDEMYSWMKSINDRISALESKNEPKDPKPKEPKEPKEPKKDSTADIVKGVRKLESVRGRTLKFMEERKLILEFNEVQRKKMEHSESESLVRWKNDKGVMYYTVLDTSSLDSLVRSKKGPDGLSLNIAKKYGVLLIDNKLVPLSRDFKDGIGISYMWKRDDKVLLPSPSWAYDKRKKQSKRFTDPRIGIVDPQTNKLWDVLGESSDEDSEDSSDESSDEESEVVDESLKEESAEEIMSFLTKVDEKVEEGVTEEVPEEESTEYKVDEVEESTEYKVDEVESVDDDNVECDFSDSDSDSESDDEDDDKKKTKMSKFCVFKKGEGGPEEELEELEELVESDQDSGSEREERKRDLMDNRSDYSDDSDDEYRRSKKSKK